MSNPSQDDFSPTETKTIELTVLDALVIATHLAFASAILAGNWQAAMEYEHIAMLANQKQTNEQADELARKLGTIVDVFGPVEHHTVG